MGHGHDHRHPDERGNTGAIGFAFFLNLFFAIAEIIGGLWTNSLAILSDALHDLGDSLILGLSYILERHSGRGRTLRYSYGYRRFSLLGALLNAVILIAGSVFIIVEAIPRLANPANPNAVGMMWFAIVGVLLNGIAVLRLRSKGRSMNARVVSWHLIEDVLGWIAVLIVSIVMQNWHLPILDPILSLLIASYILYYNVFVNFNKTIKLFLQAVPDEIDAARMEKAICAVPHVLSVHHMHVWSLDGERHVLSAHVVVDAVAGKEDVIRIKREVKEIVLGEDIEHLTIEVEFEDEDCVMGGEWLLPPPDTDLSK
ncbi:MAG: cation diffusion facilitator family transporter [Bacteroidota bacterium]|nr:cation diffusion facilitator family transporter [Bacteroidota bacterium]